MKYYALSQQKGIGCPIGMLNGALYDKYYADTSPIETGYFPWYANPARGTPHELFPAGMFFISKDKNYDFDIRSDLNFYYLISAKFNSLVSNLCVSEIDVSPITVCSRTGETVSKKRYYAAFFKNFALASVADSAESQLVQGKFGGIARIKKLVVREDFSCHIFKLTGMEGSSNTLICSETFREAAIDLGMNGVEFFDTTSVDWPTVKPI